MRDHITHAIGELEAFGRRFLALAGEMRTMLGIATGAAAAAVAPKLRTVTRRPACRRTKPPTPPAPKPAAREKAPRKQVKSETVYQAIAASTGLTCAELETRFGLVKSTVMYHLHRLDQEGRITQGRDLKWRKTVTAPQPAVN